MNFIEVSHLGRVTRVTNGTEMQKPMGIEPDIGREIILTNEEGELIGYGRGVDKMLKSMPVIQAIKEAPLLKSQTKVITRKAKPLLKSMTAKPYFTNPAHSKIWGRLDSVGK
jgi:hypothetical protein